MAKKKAGKGKKRSHPKIRLEHAFRWECPSCGTLNYDNGVYLEITPPEQAVMAEMYECDPDEFKTGDWIGSPETVKCRKCKDEFDCEPMKMEDGPGMEDFGDDGDD